MNVSLPKAMEEFVRKKVEVGDYETASEVVRDGLRLLKKRDEVLRAKPIDDKEIELTASKSYNPGPRSLQQDGAASAAPGGRFDHTFFDESSWSSIAESLHLPERELQVVRHVFSDHKEAWIAQTLRISPHTVNTYLQRIYHKLNVFSRSQLVLRIVTEFLDLRKRANGETREPKKKLYR